MSSDKSMFIQALLDLSAVTPFGGNDFFSAADDWRRSAGLSYSDAAAIVRRYGNAVATLSMAHALDFQFRELPTSLE